MPMSGIYYVTPVFNAVETIDETVWSVVSQAGGTAVRYHVQDGGSTDGTVEKLHAWQERLRKIEGALPSPVVFSFASESDSGMYDAITKGFATLDIPDDAFMSWINADDGLWPGAFAAVTGLARALPDVEWITGWSNTRNKHGAFISLCKKSVYPKEVLAAGLAENRCFSFLQQEGTVWRKRLWDKVHGLDGAFRMAGDWDLWRRFAAHSPLIHMQRALGFFRIRPGQLSGDLTTYYAEIDNKFPLEARMYRLQELLKHKQETSVLVADYDDEGRWRMEPRHVALKN